MKALALLLLALPLAGCASPAERSVHLAMAENSCVHSRASNQAYLHCVNVYLGSHYGWQEQALQARDGALCVENCAEAVYRRHHYRTPGMDGTMFSNVFASGFPR